jgi:release factor glutamine methyltransferase
MINKGTGQSVGETLNKLVSQLETKSETPDLDSQSLLAHLLDKPTSWLLAHPEHPLSHQKLNILEEYTSQLDAGKPLPYVLGHWEFFDLEFEVTPDVLIPRPETELLVERALAWLYANPDCRRVADIGTGSGCICVALAVNIPDLVMEATDVSAAALEVARRNASRHEVSGRMEFTCGDLFSPDSAYHLVVANLPYIPTGTLHQLPVYGREPTVALDGGVDGMLLIRRLLVEAPAHLLPGGMLLMEIEATEGLAALSQASDIFPKARIQLLRDLSGHDRLLEIQI